MDNGTWSYIQKLITQELAKTYHPQCTFLSICLCILCNLLVQSKLADQHYPFLIIPIVYLYTVTSSKKFMIFSQGLEWELKFYKRVMFQRDVLQNFHMKFFFIFCLKTLGSGLTVILNRTHDILSVINHQCIDIFSCVEFVYFKNISNTLFLLCFNDIVEQQLSPTPNHSTDSPVRVPVPCR